MMQYQVDGRDAVFGNDVRIVIEVPNPAADDVEDTVQIQVVLTSEGIILDVMDPDGDVIQTDAQTYEEIVYSMVMHD